MTAAAVDHPGARLHEALPELEALAAAELDAAAFFGRLAAGVGRATGAAGAAVWIADRGRFGLVAASGRVTQAVFADPVRVGRNERLLAEAVRLGRTARRPAAGVLAGADAAVLVPFFPGDGAAGVLELFDDGDGLDPEEPELAAGLEAVAATVRSFFDRAGEAARAADPEAAFAAYRELCRRAHGSLVTAEVAAAVVNEARRLLRCDRVWVLTRRGSRYVASAVSGQESVSRRSDEVRLAEAVAGLAAAHDGRFAFDGRAEELPAAARSLTEYVERSGVRLLWADSLRPGEGATIASDRPKRRRPPVGVILYEQFSEARPRPGLARWADAVTEQAAAAVGNAVRHEAIPFVPLLRAVGTGFAAWRGRRGLAAASVAAGLALAGYGMATATVEDRVEARGRLTPDGRRGVFAPAEAEVVEVLVRGGDRVAAGQPLLRLESDALTTRLLSARGRLDEQRQTLEGLRAGLHRAAGRDELLRQQAEKARVEIEIRGLEEEVRLLEAQIADLTVTAPIAGTVLDARPDEALAGRPVRRGEPLLEIADESGPWRIELDVPERAAGRVAAALAGGPLAVDYRLDAEPAVVRTARLGELATRTTEHPSEGAVVRGTGHPDGGPPPGSRVDAEVTARVRCGRRSVLAALFGDAFDALRRELWY